MHDPETFKNLYPCPDKGAIRQIIQDKILFGELKLPSDRMLDSKAWIEEQVKKEYQSERALYMESENAAIAAWRQDKEAEHGFSSLPEGLKQKIHAQVWADGHSGGYGEMENLYVDWVPVILEAFSFGLSCGKK